MLSRLAPRTLLYTGLAVVGFAANSLLTRAGLGTLHGPKLANPILFACIRTAAGMLTLVSIVTVKNRRLPKVSRWHWPSGLMLFSYMIFFSVAYVSVPVVAGSLIAFSAVQSVMISYGLFTGERFTLKAALGYSVAISGFFILIWPGLAAPPIVGSLLIAGSGLSWGFYSLLNKRRPYSDVFSDTAGNFVIALPLTLIVLLLSRNLTMDSSTFVLAILSGAVSSGLGYMFWMSALQDLTSIQAAIVQLAAPIVAAIGSLLFLHEPLSPRVGLAALLILSGIAAVLLNKKNRAA